MVVAAIVSLLTTALVADPWASGGRAAGTSAPVTVTSFTGTGISTPQQIAVGPDGALWFTNEGTKSIGRITTAGVLSNFTDPSISYPRGITTGPDGNLWFVNKVTIRLGGSRPPESSRISSVPVPRKSSP